MYLLYLAESEDTTVPLEIPSSPISHTVVTESRSYEMQHSWIESQIGAL